jgi:hypothetical protein
MGCRPQAEDAVLPRALRLGQAPGPWWRGLMGFSMAAVVAVAPSLSRSPPSQTAARAALARAVRGLATSQALWTSTGPQKLPQGPTLGRSRGEAQTGGQPIP